jgi:release factor glutamine methyltransferase
MPAAGEHLQAITRRLKPLSESASLDAQALLAYTLGKERSWVIAHPEYLLSPVEETGLTSNLKRLEDGEPLPYVLGHWEFYGLDLLVTPDVLIPRPETELLVEQALGWLSQRPQDQAALDVGTGSGCIAVALALHVPTLQVTALDRSAAALQVARANAARHEVAERIVFVESDLLEVLGEVKSSKFKVESSSKVETLNLQHLNHEQINHNPSTFHILLANLPYIPTTDLRDLAVARREPWEALDGGVDGLDLIRRLLGQAAPWLAPGGLALLEIEERQGEAALRLAEAAFPEAAATVLPDLTGHPRLLRIDLTG